MYFAVDDSGIILKTLEKLFVGKYEYHAFSKGMRALKYLREEGDPDLIMQVPVLFLTSNNDRQHVMKAVSSGANDYAVKPIDEELLMDKVHSLLKEEKKKLSWDDV